MFPDGLHLDCAAGPAKCRLRTCGTEERTMAAADDESMQQPYRNTKDLRVPPPPPI